MSQANVETVRRVYEAAASRDSAAVISLYDPAVELDCSRTIGDVLGGGVYQGHEGLRELFRAWHDAWDEVEYDYEDLIDAGDHVVAVVTRRARGRSSGAAVEVHLALLWTIHEGKVTRVVWFTSRDEALDAAGLSP